MDPARVTPQWQVTRSHGPADQFHRRTVSEPVVNEVWVHAVTGPALVLGSSQPDNLIDQDRAAASGVEVARRRSGGGLVGLVPGNDCWIDVILARSSPLWCDDIGLAFGWLGRVWAGALIELLAPVDAATVSVHPGPLLRSAAGRLVCFAGLGPGEVSVGGRKVVGLSLRRWKTGARFQCAMTWLWQPELLSSYLEPAALATLRAAGLDLAELPVGLPHPDEGPTIDQVTDRFLAHLPDPAAPLPPW